MPSPSNSEDEDFREGFHDLPSEKERKAMSVLALAEVLATRKKDSPAYIVLDHELNLKIAKVQAKATLNAGWLGAGATIIAVLIGFALGYYTGNPQTQKSNELKQNETSPAPAINANSAKPEPVPLTPVHQATPIKPLEVKPANENAKQTSKPRNAKPSP